MSQLNKLQITGIRSFDHKTSQYINFYHPLTLIVGHNGSGKTTIIECLKFATTGDQPPNTKGGGFVHDPKLENVPEIKGQVKLSFRNIAGQEVVVTRSLMVSVAKTGKYSSKTLESLLLLRHQFLDYQVGLSSTCAEINEELPNHLGVSRPILDNVIFCHQEDSFWPLSETSVLKKKFDDIFAATRYTKALDTMKKLRKKLGSDLGKLETQVATLKINRENAAELSKNMQKRISERDKDLVRKQELEDVLIKNVLDRMEEARKIIEEKGILSGRVDQYTVQRDMTAKNIDQLARSTTILQDSDQELQARKQDIELSTRSQNSDCEKLEIRKVEIEREMNSIQTQISQKFSVKGALESENNLQVERISKRKEMIINLMKKFNFSDFQVNEFDDYCANAFLTRLEQEVSQKLKRINADRASARQKETTLNQEIQTLKSQLSGLEQKKKLTRESMAAVQKKISVFTQQIQAMPDSVEDISEIDESIRRAESKVEKCREALQELERESNVAELQMTLSALDRQASKCNDEMSVLALQGDTRARLKNKQADRQRKTEAYNSALIQMKPDAENLLKKPFSPASLEQDLTHLITTQEGLIKTAKEKLKSVNAAKAGIEARLSMVRQTINQKTAEHDEKQAKVDNVCGGLEYNAALEKAESEVKTYGENVANMKSASSMYGKFIAKFEQSRCCPLCTRSFENQSLESQFKTKLTTTLSKIPQAAKASEAELVKWNENLQQLRNLQTVWSDCERIAKQEIPEAKTKRDQLEREMAAQFHVVEEIEAEISISEAELNHIIDLKTKAVQAKQIHAEIQQLERDSNTISKDLGASGLNRSMEEIQKELEDVNSQIKSTRLKIDRTKEEISYKNQELASFESQVKDLQQNKMKIQYQSQAKEKLKLDIKDLRNEHANLAKAQANVDSEIGDLPRRIESVQFSLASHQTQVSKEEELFQKEIQNLREGMNSLNGIHSEILKYVQSNKEANLTQCKVEIVSLEERLKSRKIELETVLSKIDLISKQQSEIQLTLRNIADNLTLRQFRNDQIENEAKIRDLKKQIESLNTASTRIESEYQILHKQKDELERERSHIVGKLQVLEDNIQLDRKKLSSDYKNVEKNFETAKYELVAKQLAISDLEEYCVKLEEAIMKFHEKKMEEVNKTIRDIWLKTYKGVDIDTIMIKADPDTNARRSFNYRVVMVKAEHEMDMRGRCSAGQKVLASIIIRLALAESFCLQCGILALDEPTTNLDVGNIAGLAQALADIIESRSVQRNFQLIVITHDEDFVQALGRTRHADHFFRVDKNKKGFSTITKKQIMTEEDQEIENLREMRKNREDDLD